MPWTGYLRLPRISRFGAVNFSYLSWKRYTEKTLTSNHLNSGGHLDVSGICSSCFYLKCLWWWALCVLRLSFPSIGIIKAQTYIKLWDIGNIPEYSLVPTLSLVQRCLHIANKIGIIVFLYQRYNILSNPSQCKSFPRTKFSHYSFWALTILVYPPYIYSSLSN